MLRVRLAPSALVLFACVLATSCDACDDDPPATYVVDDDSMIRGLSAPTSMSFTSTGGFALHLARSCEHVEAIDSSEHAIRSAEANRDMNGITNVSFREADVFDVLTGYAGARRKFDTVVLDPPAFTKSRQQIEGAARGYKEINQRALRLLDSGGILVTCSCSHHFSESLLLEVLAEASLDTGKILRVLERRAQAKDHPILLTVPETHYLKCLIVQVV